jgi:hypothetical protein
MTNEELIAQAVKAIEKSLITSTDLATAGAMNPEQVDRFVDYVIDVTALKNNVRVVKFKPESMYIDKIGVGTRVSMLASEASSPSMRRGVNTSRITLTPVEVMTPFEISYNFIEINIEGQSVEEHIVRMMSTQTANDLEEQMINGDTLGHARLEDDLKDTGSTTEYIKDSFIAAYDGWLRLADSGNIYDANGADISSTVFSRMLLRLPIKFRRNRRDMRYLVSLDHEQLYLEKLASRATAAGDAALEGIGRKPFGIPLVGVPLLESEPLVVEHATVGAAPDTVNLRYAPIDGTSVVVTDQTLGQIPVTPYVVGAGNDYTVDATAGTVTTLAGGALAAGGNIKITYQSRGQLLFTNFMNLILAIGRDMTLKKDEDIFKRVNQFALTTKIDVNIEEATALVKGINVGIN